MTDVPGWVLLGTLYGVGRWHPLAGFVVLRVETLAGGKGLETLLSKCATSGDFRAGRLSS